MVPGDVAIDLSSFRYRAVVLLQYPVATPKCPLLGAESGLSVDCHGPPPEQPQMRLVCRRENSADGRYSDLAARSTLSHGTLRAASGEVASPSVAVSVLIFAD